MRVSRALLLSVFVLLIPAAALATTGSYEEVKCPVCGNEFEGWVWGSTNTHLRDGDFCPHALGDQVLMLDGWTCPKCLYSGFKPDFDPKTKPQDLIARLKKGQLLKAPAAVSPRLKRCTSIPAWVRKDLYLQILELRGGIPPRVRMWVALNAAWTQRFDPYSSRDREPKSRSLVPPELQARFDALPPAHSGKKAKADPLDPHGYHWSMAHARERDALNPDCELTTAERRLCLLDGAWLLKQRGEDPAASRLLRHLHAMGSDLTKTERKLAVALEQRIARERHYAGIALRLLKEAIKTKDWGREDPNALKYLLGELYRKLGREDQARKTLNAVASDAEADAWVRQWAKRSLGRLGAPKDK